MYVSVAIKSDTKKINKTTEATIMLTSILENIGSRDYDNFTKNQYYRVYYKENFLGLGATDSENQNLKVICLIQIN